MHRDVAPPLLYDSDPRRHLLHRTYVHTWQLVGGIHEALQQDSDLKKTVPPLPLPGRTKAKNKHESGKRRGGKGLRPSTSTNTASGVSFIRIMFHQPLCQYSTDDLSNRLRARRLLPNSGLSNAFETAAGDAGTLLAWAAVVSCPANRYHQKIKFRGETQKA